MKTKANAQLLKNRPAKKRAVLYARVSSEDQTKGNYTSCESQIEELRDYCQRQDYEVVAEIRDDGYSAGSLKRPGLTRVRQLVQEEKVDSVISTWFDRFMRTIGFHAIASEFKKRDAQFVSVHDPADTTTATGRMMQSFLVVIKACEREQTSEKVSNKMKMRQRKGMWNGGKTPFGFLQVDANRTIMPDPERKTLLNDLFRIYVETRSDTKVARWLEANGIPARSGSSRWQVSTIRKILTNRRYIAQIEVNRENKGLDGLPEDQLYQVASAPYEPIVDISLFETAQVIREQQSLASPNRVGRPRSFSQTQCGRVYPLQGLMVCAICGHSMTPYHIYHKAGTEKNGKKRKNDSYVCSCVCAKQIKGWKACDHRNYILASKTETFILGLVPQLLSDASLLDEIVQHAQEKSREDLAPTRQALRENAATLRKVEQEQQEITQKATCSQFAPALWDLLNGQASCLQTRKTQLLIEKNRLEGILSVVQVDTNADDLRRVLQNLDLLLSHAQPEELQRLMRSLFQRIEWCPPNLLPQRNHKIQLHSWGAQNQLAPTSLLKPGQGVLNCDVQRYRVGDSNP